jgi:NADH-quinone oxidoreductase subunit G
MCARLLQQYGRVGERNNGLVGVWHNANLQGAWELGYRPPDDLDGALKASPVIWVAGADPLGDDPTLEESLWVDTFLVVQDLYMTKTAEMADIVLPAAAYTEREGSFTSGERRVQRFTPASPGMPGPRADFAIAAQVGERIGIKLEGKSPLVIMDQISQHVGAFAGVSYQALSEVVQQEPDVSRADLYYGGTSFENRIGLGVQLPLAASEKHVGDVAFPQELGRREGGLPVYPVTRLYDHGGTIGRTELLDQRRAGACLHLHPATAAALQLAEGGEVAVSINGVERQLSICLDDTLPRGVGVIPRSVGVPLDGPSTLKIISEELVDQEAQDQER